jgi:hypothetical protein
VSREEYRPPWAPHVVGLIDPHALDVDSMPIPRRIDIRCEHSGCGATWQATCTSGAVRTHVNNFAKSHVHRDVFENPRPNPIETKR